MTNLNHIIRTTDGNSREQISLQKAESLLDNRSTTVIFDNEWEMVLQMVHRKLVIVVDTGDSVVSYMTDEQNAESVIMSDFLWILDRLSDTITVEVDKSCPNAVETGIANAAEFFEDIIIVSI